MITPVSLSLNSVADLLTFPTCSVILVCYSEPATAIGSIVVAD